MIDACPVLDSARCSKNCSFIEFVNGVEKLETQIKNPFTEDIVTSKERQKQVPRF